MHFYEDIMILLTVTSHSADVAYRSDGSRFDGEGGTRISQLVVYSDLYWCKNP